jgi:hypothetical protein
MLYASEPWAVVSGSLTDQIPAESDRRAAQSFVRQAREYFTAAERADTIESRPLLDYYSFLNLAKALALARRRPGWSAGLSMALVKLPARGSHQQRPKS